jgi:hypothetical protein
VVAYLQGAAVSCPRRIAAEGLAALLALKEGRDAELPGASFELHGKPMEPACLVGVAEGVLERIAHSEEASPEDSGELSASTVLESLARELDLAVEGKTLLGDKTKDFPTLRSVDLGLIVELKGLDFDVCSAAIDALHRSGDALSIVDCFYQFALTSTLCAPTPVVGSDFKADAVAILGLVPLILEEGRKERDGHSGNVEDMARILRARIINDEEDETTFGRLARLVARYAWDTAWGSGGACEDEIIEVYARRIVRAAFQVAENSAPIRDLLESLREIE